jgi:membrane protein implicated in regulation of membrane protease activity
MLIYGAIAAFGFLVVLLMLVAGDLFGGDHEIGHDGALSHVEGDASGPSMFSVRIMSSFVTAFGVGGIIGRFYGFSHPAASGIGVLSGLGTATVVYQFARILYSQQASSELHMNTLIGRTAEVSIAIVDDAVGQVTLTVSGQRTEHLARSSDRRAIPRGTEVTITALSGDSVIVTRTAGASGGTK